MSEQKHGAIQPARRKILAGAALSVGGLLAIANVGTPAFAKSKQAAHNAAAEQDAGLLNAAIALEHEGIAAYQIAAGSGLLSKGVLQVGVLFQSHHKRHRDLLSDAVRRLGGKPAIAKSDADYAKDIGAAALKTEADVLKLALKLELGAANAYVGLIAPLNNRDLATLIGRIGEDEAGHFGYLSAATNTPLPAEAPYFG